MPKYVIERTIPGVGALSQAELQTISRKSVSVVRALGPDIQWVHSYVVNDKIYCVYNAKNTELVKEHAVKGGFPADLIAEVRDIIDPVTGGA